MTKQLPILLGFFLTILIYSQETNAQCSFTPTVTLSPNDADGTYCPNEVLTLSTQLYDSYQWYYNFANSNSGGTPWPGGTGQFIEVDASQWALTYFYVVATQAGCSEASATSSWDSWVFLAPSIASSGQTNYCIGESTVISNAFPGPAFFQWYLNGAPIPEANMPSYTVTETGTYTLSAAYAECPNYWLSSGVGPSFIFNGPTTPVITESNGTLFSDSGPNWQWYVDGQFILGATASSYTPGANGTYEVVVTDANGCTATSDPFLFPPAPLPIDLISFSAELQTNCETVVHWEVSERSTVAAYVIEYSETGKYYEEVKTIIPADPSQITAVYKQPIVMPNSGYLRLRMHDLDGSVKYSSIYFLEIPCGLNENAFKFYPNPASNYLTIENIENIKVVLRVFDINGSLMIRKNMIDSTFDLDISAWENGVYQILIEGSTMSWRHRLVKL